MSAPTIVALPKDKTTLILGAAVVAYFLFFRKPAAPDAPARSAGAGGASDPYTAAINALAPIAQNAAKTAQAQLTDDGSDLRQGLKKLGDNGIKASPVGWFAHGPTHKQTAQAYYNNEYSERLDAENFAALVHQRLSRADVEQWVVGEDGTLSIKYKGIKEPFKQIVPARAGKFRIAWAEEAIVRALGAPLQRGRRIGTPFVRHDPPAFSDSNPYAYPSQTVSGVKKTLADPNTQNAYAKRLGDAVSTRSQKVLQTQGYLKGDLIPDQNPGTQA